MARKVMLFAAVIAFTVAAWTTVLADPICTCGYCWSHHLASCDDPAGGNFNCADWWQWNCTY